MESEYQSTSVRGKRLYSYKVNLCSGARYMPHQMQTFINIIHYDFVRRASQVAPEQGEAANAPRSDPEKDNQKDCQRAKQVPLNPGGGT